ncbi:MAG: DUF4012 domain-containing protein, partial [Mycobacteriales bacterium]
HDGERLDGVLSVDPIALGWVLDATGPVTDKKGHQLSGGQFVKYSLADVYALYPNKDRRTEALVDAAHAVLDAVIAGRGGTSALAERLGHSIVTRHLALYSAHEAEQQVLASTPLAAALPQEARPLLGVMMQEAVASKLCYYVRKSIQYSGAPPTTQLDLGLGHGPQPVQQATVTIRLTNTAPVSGLPLYVAPDVDIADGRPLKPGTVRLAVSTYLARGGVLERAILDGKPLSMTSETEKGLSVLTTAVWLPPGGSTTLVLHILQPAEPGASLRVLDQPLAFPDEISVN